jgi:hypothetical protein
LTDAEALTRIRYVLDIWFKGDLTEFEALARISRITGQAKK